jgi:hypothetical protein
VAVHRAAARARTATGWLDSWHSFSFGDHYDPANTHFGLLLACNHDTLAPGGGFPPHRHRATEIVTWVLAGSLVHQDSAGHDGVVLPGVAQRLSSGGGIEHSERNGSDREPVRYVQMWVAADPPGGEPGYATRDLRGELAVAGGGLVVVASGMGEHAGTGVLGLRQAGAALFVARLPAGTAVDLPGEERVHLLVCSGTVELSGGSSGTGPGGGEPVRLAAGDAARVRRPGGQGSGGPGSGGPGSGGPGSGGPGTARLWAPEPTGPARVAQPPPAEVLIWAMRGTLGPPG